MGLKAKIASLVVDLSANSASFNSEMAKSKKTAGSWATDVKKYAKAASAALAASGLAAAAGLVVLTKASMTNIDALAKHADKIGITTKALAGMRHQAELNGVANNALDMGLQRMVRRISEAAHGTGVASTALAELGLNAEELNKLSPDQQFSAIADAMEDVSNQSDKVRLGFKLFDSGGVGLINVMRGGSAAMAEAQQEANALGITISRIDAAKIEAANDATLRSEQVWKGLGNTLAINVSPFITAMKTDFTESAIANDGFRDQVATGMKVVSKSIGFAGNAIRGMQLVWKGTQLVVATFTAATLTNLTSLSRSLAEFASLIPGIDIKIDPNSGIAGLAKAARSQVEKLASEMHEMAMQKLPSDSVDEYFEKITADAQEAAEKIIEVTAEKAANQAAVEKAALEKSEAEKLEIRKVAADAEAQVLADQAKDLAKKEKAAQKQALSAFSQASGQVLSLIEDSGKKQSAAYKAIFLAQQAAQIVMTIANAEAAATATVAHDAPIMGVASLTTGNIVRASGYLSAGVIAGQAIAGIAHGGIDEIPEESTWLLQKGERVLSPSQNKEVQKAAEKINATSSVYSQNLPNKAVSYSSVPKNKAANDENKRAGGVVVNIHEDANRAGQVDRETGLTQEDVINIYVANVKQEGAAALINQHTYGLERVGR
jgi:vacuolar-type H+-ATPase subunit E/Vma4